jgi:carbon-monoxide dehydrogenase small subunit
VEITKTVEVAHPVERVWQALCDINLVADCLPGASITADLGDDRYKGRFHVRLGPLAAAFDGEVGIERQPQTLSGTVSGKGADAKSSSRASGALNYRLEREDAGRTRISVQSEINLAGSLAQFGKAAVMQEIANRITLQFVTNLERRLAETAKAAEQEVTPSVPPPDPHGHTPNAPTLNDQSPGARRPHVPAPDDQSLNVQSHAGRPLDAGGLLWSILRDRIVAFFRRLFGSAPRP